MKIKWKETQDNWKEELEEKMDSSVLAFIEQRITSNHAAADIDFSADLITSARNRTYIKTHLLMNWTDIHCPDIDSKRDKISESNICFRFFFKKREFQLDEVFRY